jgi:hypothetical protein
MNIQLDENEINIIKKAASEVETWHFNKYWILILIITGAVVGMGVPLYNIMIAKEGQSSILDVAISFVLFVVAMAWLRSNWGKTSSEKAVEIVYVKMREH